MNAAVLGMSRRETRRRFNDIVEFAGIEPFMDTPLKRYSNGMRLRLAFAVAAHVEAEILVMDEVLAVGDAEFQRRCLGKLSELNDSGRTVLFVSHDHGAITQLCSRAIWLDHGEVRAEGEPADVVSAYLRAGLEAGSVAELTPPPNAPAMVRSLALVDESGRAGASVERGKPIEIRLALEQLHRVQGLDLSVYLLDDRGVRVLDEAWLDQCAPPSLPEGASELSFRIPGFLAPGRYTAGIWVGDSTEAFHTEEALSFDVLPQASDRSGDRPRRVAQPPVEWSARPCV